MCIYIYIFIRRSFRESNKLEQRVNGLNISFNWRDTFGQNTITKHVLFARNVGEDRVSQKEIKQRLIYSGLSNETAKPGGDYSFYLANIEPVILDSGPE